MFTLQRSAMATVRSSASGNFAEDLRHLFGGLEEKLVGGKFHALRVAHGLAGLNAQQHFLRVGVGTA